MISSVSSSTLSSKPSPGALEAAMDMMESSDPNVIKKGMEILNSLEKDKKDKKG